MRRNRQLISDGEAGDCMRACLTSMLDIPNDPSYLPGADDKEWFIKFRRFLMQFGIEMCNEHKAMWRYGYWMASVPSLNFEGKTHAIVMKGDRVEFDPSTKKRYRRGKSLLGENVVLGCNYLEVVDASKLKNLIPYQKLP